MKPGRTMGKLGSFVLVVAGFFVAMLDTTIVNVALPSVGRDLGLSVGALQWVVNAYTLVLASLLLASGSLSDRWGAHRVYGLGLVVFAVASALCALAPGLGVVLGGRALQGAAAACLVSSSLVLVAHLGEDPPARARAIGGWGAVGGVAAALGPVLGGTLGQMYSWRAVFWVNVPLCVLTVVALRRARRSLAVPGSRTSRFDIGGQVLSLTMLTSATLSLITLGSRGVDWRVAAMAALAVIAGCLFVLVELHHRSPLVDVRLFSSAPFSATCAVGFALNFSFFGQLFILSLYLQGTLGLGVSESAAVIFPQTCTAVVAAPLGGKLAARWGTSPVMVAGLVAGAVGLSGMSLVAQAAHAVEAAQAAQLLWLAVCSVVASFGMAFAMPAASAAAVEAVPSSRRGMASGIINTMRQIGTVFGTAVLGVVFASGAQGTGFTLGLGVAAGVYVAAALLVLVTSPRDSSPG